MLLLCWYTSCCWCSYCCWCCNCADVASVLMLLLLLILLLCRCCYWARLLLLLWILLMPSFLHTRYFFLPSTMLPLLSLVFMMSLLLLLVRLISLLAVTWLLFCYKLCIVKVWNLQKLSHLLAIRTIYKIDNKLLFLCTTLNSLYKTFDSVINVYESRQHWLLRVLPPRSLLLRCFVMTLSLGFALPS